MARVNIFQKLAEHDNIANDVARIDKLFNEIETVGVLRLSNYTYVNYTLVDFVDEFCFFNWKNHGHCINVEDYFDKIGYEALKQSAMNGNSDDFISFAEIVLNFHKIVCVLFEGKEEEDASFQLYPAFYQLNTIIIEDLSHINHKAAYDADNEKVLIVEDRPEITAVAETVGSKLSIEVVRYNHHSLAGDLDAKKSILLQIGADLEPKRNDIKSINKQLADDIFYMLNTMNIRHNNCDSGNATKYKKFVAEMSETDLESWYDELYQSIV